MPARYADEESHLNIRKQLIPHLGGHIRNSAKRIIYHYFWRDISPVSLYLVVGLGLNIVSLVFGLKFWILSSFYGQVATAGKVMLAALPLIIGSQFLFSAWQMDMGNEPRLPLNPRIKN